jgi:hypothetical protein
VDDHGREGQRGTCSALSNARVPRAGSCAQMGVAEREPRADHAEQ